MNFFTIWILPGFLSVLTMIIVDCKYNKRKFNMLDLLPPVCLSIFGIINTMIMIEYLYHKSRERKGYE